MIEILMRRIKFNNYSIESIVSTIGLVIIVIIWGYFEHKRDKERIDNERNRDIK